MFGAAPPATMTDSDTSGSTTITRGPSVGSASTKTGDMYDPEGSTIRT